MFVYHVVPINGDPSRGVLKAAEVEVGLDDGARVEIARGLIGTEQVVIRASGVLREGDPVIAVPEDES